MPRRVDHLICFKDTGKWTVNAGVYYDAWSGHEGGNLSAYVEGISEPQQLEVQLDNLSKVQYEDGLFFMALVTINITKVWAC